MKQVSKITLGVSSSALTVIIQNVNDDTVKVSIGKMKWASKVAGGLVALFSPVALLAFPAAVATLVGTVKQNNMFKDIDGFIKERLILID